MAINTFGTLKSAVASWLHRSDLTATIPDFIALAESAIRRDVRCRAMEQTATGTLSASTLALPDRFAEARRVVLGTTIQRYITPEDWYQQRDSVNGQYTIVGQNFCFQSTTSDYTIDYYEWFEVFAADGDTNWLLQTHPEVYLFGALMEATAFTGGDFTAYAARYQAAVQQVRESEARARYAGPMAIRAETVG